VYFTFLSYKTEGKHRQWYCKKHTFSQCELPHSVCVNISNIHSSIFRCNNIMRHVKMLWKYEDNH
jgi:hypothetical protein